MRHAPRLVSLVSFVNFCGIHEGFRAAQERDKVVRRIFTIILAVVVICLIIWVWKTHSSGNVFGDGAIVEQHESNSSSNDQTAMNNGATTDLDGNTEAHPNPSRSDDPGTINGVPVGSSGSQSATGSTPMGTPMTNSTPPQPSPVSAPGGLAAQPGHTPVLGPGTPLPGGDSLTPNAPNRVAFGGTGKYMWYRQGDLTWRVDSNTGASCIAFATLEQWARPIVYQNGCASRRG